MATYTQWHRGGRRFARVTYVCGPEPVLVEDVVTAARALGGQTETFFAGEDKDSLIWTTAGTYPERPEARRLIVVRAAERLKEWGPLEHILAAYRAMPESYLLLAASDAEYPDKETPHGALLRKSTSAAMIRCSSPSGEDLLDWVCAKVPGIGRNYADSVATAAHHELAAIRNLCEKVAALPSPPPVAELPTYADDAAEVEFADALLTGDKVAALAAARVMRESQLGMAIGLLDSRLAALEIIAPAAARKAGVYEIAKLGVKEWLVKKLLPVAPSYVPATISRRRDVLLSAAEALRTGSFTGVPEAIVALW